MGSGSFLLSSSAYFLPYFLPLPLPPARAISAVVKDFLFFPFSPSPSGAVLSPPPPFLPGKIPRGRIFPSVYCDPHLPSSGGGNFKGFILRLFFCCPIGQGYPSNSFVQKGTIVGRATKPPPPPFCPPPVNKKEMLSPFQ